MLSNSAANSVSFETIYGNSYTCPTCCPNIVTMKTCVANNCVAAADLKTANMFLEWANYNNDCKYTMIREYQS